MKIIAIGAVTAGGRTGSVFQRNFRLKATTFMETGLMIFMIILKKHEALCRKALTYR